jgi:hypothetical protein
MKLRAIVIILASSLYGLYLGLEKPPIMYGVIGGLIVGFVLVGIVQAVAWLLRKFREKAPRAAAHTGAVAFWLGIIVAVWLAGVTAYSIYGGAPAKLLAGMSVFYGLFGLGHSIRAVE